MIYSLILIFILARFIQDVHSKSILVSDKASLLSVYVLQDVIFLRGESPVLGITAKTGHSSSSPLI